MKRAAVIGTGMMGPGIAVSLALGGLETVLVSRTSDGAKVGLAEAQRLRQFLVDQELASAGEGGALSSVQDLAAAVEQADLVVESGPEAMEFKQDLFARLDSIAPARTILATNTSGLSVTAIAARCQRPERILTTHFWNPPHLMPLVEIVRGGQTADSTVDEVRDALFACGKVPVVIRKDTPGQLGNRLQMALFREAIHIVAEGIAGVEDVDLAARYGFGLRLPQYGMFEHMDMVGFDIVRAVMDYVSQDLERGRETPRLMRELCERGETGARAGKGFYDWSQKSATEVAARRERWLLEMAKRRKQQAAQAGD